MVSSLGLEYAILSLTVLRITQLFSVSKSGMRNGDNLYNDGLNAQCQNNGQTTWSVMAFSSFAMPLADLPAQDVQPGRGLTPYHELRMTVMQGVIASGLAALVSALNAYARTHELSPDV
jgi:hypothetical protein